MSFYIFWEAGLGKISSMAVETLSNDVLSGEAAEKSSHDGGRLHLTQVPISLLLPSVCLVSAFLKDGFGIQNATRRNRTSLASISSRRFLGLAGQRLHVS